MLIMIHRNTDVDMAPATAAASVFVEEGGAARARVGVAAGVCALLTLYLVVGSASQHGGCPRLRLDALFPRPEF